jgi:hypothetical protein
VALKQRNDALWFCLVLLVEVFGLSVALGGPWIEVSYFLLVVVSQTVAGAYIWAYLRRNEQQLPIPELLAMGFAIGSSSAAISQLILRDLLGIRLMISPYVPIIAVTIWLIVKQSPKLGVEITHTDSTTLLWLLFPAPLAMTQYSYPTFIFFVIPFFIFAVSIGSKKLKLIFFSRIAIPFISIFSYVLGSFINFTSNNGTGISRIIADDSRFDFAHALGTARWGINANIEFVNQTYSYYKISYLWLGPIFAPRGVKAIDLFDFSISVVFLTLIGIALWSLSFRITAKSKVSHLAAVIVFVLTALPDPIQINLRVLHLLGLIYLLTVAVLLLATQKTNLIVGFLTLAFSGFIVAATRFSYVYQLIPFILVSRLRPRVSLKNLLKPLEAILFFAIGILIALVLFSYKNGSTLYGQGVLSASAWPIKPTDSTRFLIVSTVASTLPILLIYLFTKDSRHFRFFIFLSLMTLLSSQIFVPHLFVRDNDFLISFLLITSPFVANAIIASIEKLPINKVIGFFLIGLVFLGVLFRFLYDRFNRPPTNSRKLVYELHRLVNNDLALNYSYIMVASALAASVYLFLGIRQIKILCAIVITTFLCLSCGVFLGTAINPIMDSIIHDEKLVERKIPLMVERWDDQDRLQALVFAKARSYSDDIFASNFGLFEDTGNYDDYRVQIALERRLYLTGRYSYLYENFPSLFKFPRHSRTKLSDLDRFSQELSRRFKTTIEFPIRPNDEFLQNMLDQNVKWFVVDLERTKLRDWEPWATTRFINEKVAVLELATNIEG